MTSLDNAYPSFPELFRDDVLRIETDRMWLRWPNAADADALQELASIEAACRGDSWPRHLAKSEAMERIARLRAENEAGGALTLVLTLKGVPHKPIGLIGVAAKPGGTGLALGYLLSAEHQGYGLMTEAVQALVGTVFRYTAFRRIKGIGGRGNIASQRVLEKAGFRGAGRDKQVSSARKSSSPCETLEVTRTDWRERARSSAAMKEMRASTAARNEMPCGQAA